MAGLGKSCSHVGALLFYVDATVRIRDSKTVTQEKAYWLLPTVHRECEYKEIADIDFTAEKTMKRKLDCRIDNNMNSTADSPKPQKKSCFEKYSTPSDQDLSNLFDALSKCSSKPAILSIVPPYSKNYVPKVLEDNYPKILTELYDLTAVDKNYLELTDICKSIELSVTEEQISTVEHATCGQAGVKAWFQLRSGRITASKIYSVCHTKPDVPSQSLIKAICYPESYRLPVTQLLGDAIMRRLPGIYITQQ